LPNDDEDASVAEPFGRLRIALRAAAGATTLHNTHEALNSYYPIR